MDKTVYYLSFLDYKNYPLPFLPFTTKEIVCQQSNILTSYI